MRHLYILFLLATVGFGQTQNVTQDIATKRLRADVKVPSGKALTIEAGGALNIASGATVSGLISVTPLAAGDLIVSDGSLNWIRVPKGADGDFLTVSAGSLTWDLPSFAPLTAKYIVQTADSTLPNEQSLGALSTGLLKNTVSGGTGVLSTASPTNDYWAPPSSPANGDLWYYNGTSWTKLSRGSNGQILVSSSTSIQWGSAGAGDVAGPSSSTDSRLALFDSTTGKLLKQSSDITESGGVLTSDTALGLSAGGSNQNVTITPTGSGDVIIDPSPTTGQNVMIGTTTDSGARLTVVDQSETDVPLALRRIVVGNSSTVGVLTFDLESSGGAGSTGFGPGNVFLAEDSSTTSQVQAAIESLWTTATHGSATANLRIGTVISGSYAERWRINDSGGMKVAAYGSGSLVSDGSGNITVSSDVRKKDVLGSFDRGLSEIRKLNPILYRWNAKSGMETSGTYAGFSAQNVQSAIPEAVGQTADGYLTLQDRPIIAALVNGEKYLDRQRQALWVAVLGLAALQMWQLWIGRRLK